MKSASEAYRHPNPGGVRDRKVIDETLASIGELYRQRPELADIRLGQFLVNLLTLNGLAYDSLYIIETEALKEMVDAYPAPAFKAS